MTNNSIILKIAVPVPINRLFDFLPLEENNQHCDDKVISYRAGCRVLVPFGRKQYIGVIIASSQHSDVPANKLKSIIKLIDTQPVLSEEIMSLAGWAAKYYQHAIGEVYSQIIPVAYREVEQLNNNQETYWRLTELGLQLNPENFKRAKRQLSLWQGLKQAPEGISQAQMAVEQSGTWRPALNKMLQLGWVEKIQKERATESPIAEDNFPDVELLNDSRLTLNEEQQQALDTLCQTQKTFTPSLIDGITGSGKTEVYLQFIEQILKSERQVLVLVPEIGLTPQLYTRFQKRFNTRIVVLHSSVSKHQRLQNWLSASSGQARIVIGTRSAVFIPMPQLGAVILDEEHDLSFKQQDGFRYHARDVAMVRGKQLNIPVVLGSATPSLESLANVQEQRYRSLKLTQRAGAAKAVHFTILDVRNKLFEHGISHALKYVIQTELEQNNQVLLFQNRRGYSPVIYCHQCGWIARCNRCDANMTVHQKQGYMACHHCDTQSPLPQRCPSCGSYQLDFIGAGTQRVEESMEKLFPGIEVIRIDRDSTRRKGSFEAMIERLNAGHKQILVGTQMLSKGHHFPNVTLVVILNVDQALFSLDFRSREKLAQLIVQVAGRAGREEKQGRVILQTHQPEHEFFQQLVGQGYAVFAQQELKNRKFASLPPYCFMALLRSEAIQDGLNQQFLSLAADLARKWCLTAGLNHLQVMGPVPAPMEKRSGRYRSQLLIQSPNRKALQYFMEKWLPQITELPQGRRVRWSIDIDPQDLS